MGDVALITGCSTGIGHASARALVAAGFDVFASARRLDTIAELEAAGCRLLQLDVTDEASMAAAVAQIDSERGAIDILVNNAGYGQQGALEETTVAQFRDQFETNVFGPVRLCQLALPAMRARGRGRIVMMSSMGARITFPGGSAYHGSKYALDAISNVLRFEVARFGIHVVLVEPGLVATQYGAAAIERLAGRDEGPYRGFTAGVRAALETSFAGKIEGTSTADEVAAAVRLAATEDPPRSRYVVGAMAEQLIGLRQQLSDDAWDEMMQTMYPQPAPE
jgi:NAD(P)-dependent dehydrogenase (short-subunit alcohol dehydrogenase family)